MNQDGSQDSEIDWVESGDQEDKERRAESKSEDIWWQSGALTETKTDQRPGET